MKLIKKTKKGFTLVELVVVIAIIAILSGVSVAVYVSVTNKAKQTADSEIVAQLNLQMKAQEVYGNNVTCKDAYDDAWDIGFDLAKMKPSYGDHYVWDQVNDRFAVMKGDEIIAQDKDKPLTDVTYKRWIFVNSISSDSKRSQFLTDEEFDDPVIINSAGFDAGKNKIVPSVTYENDIKKDVIIRTNGGKLTIDAKYDTVNHYGELASLEITAIDTASYHEFGYTAMGQIKTGRIVIEDATLKKDDGEMVDAAVEGLFLVSLTEGTETTPGSFDKIIIETKGDAEMPTLDRNEVVIDQEKGTKVCEVKTPEDNRTIWLTSNGVYENVTINSVDATSAGQTHPTEGTDMSEAAWDIANAAKRNDQGQLVDAQDQPISNPADAIVSEKPTKDDVEKGSLKFAGGAGSETAPYLISNETHFQNIEEGDSFSSQKHYQLLNDIEITDLQSSSDNTYSIVCLVNNGVFIVLDGAGYSITCENDEIESIFGDFVCSELNNVVVNVSSPLNGFVQQSSFNNVELNSNDTLYFSNNTGIFGYYFFYADFNKVYVNANVVGSSYSGVFMGYNFGGEYNLIDCVYSGYYVSVYSGLVFGNPTYSAATINIKNFVNNGVIRHTNNELSTGARYVLYGIDNDGQHGNKTVTIDGTDYSGSKCADLTLSGSGNYVVGPQDTGLAIAVNTDKTFTIHKSSDVTVAYYEVEIIANVANLGEYGGSTNISVLETIIATDAEQYVSQLKDFGFANGTSATYKLADEWDIITIADKDFYLEKNSDYYCGDRGTQTSIFVRAYNSTGVLISVSMLQR